MRTINLCKFCRSTLTNKITFILILFVTTIIFFPAMGNTPSSDKEYLHNLNILQGLPEILGKGSITHYQFTAMLFNVTKVVGARGHNIITTCKKGPNSFPDVPPTHEFKKRCTKNVRTGCYKQFL